MAMRVAVATAILVLAPRAALACPVCGLVGVEDNATAYVNMSIMLMALPLGMILGVVIWLYRSVRRAEAGARIPSPGRSTSS
ncbi:MAG: hypothetical protein HYX77_03380 [Acidobacteria bacterium]|nr:hypothetical protein [Acidobacteriota bacterium]